MSASTSSVSPLIVKTSTDHARPDYYTTINLDGNVSYQHSTIVRQTYSRPPKPKYRYTIEQEGKSYRCCRWCRYWCTRKCSLCSRCDEIFSCPLICYILGALFLLSLLAGILTLFALHPDINPDRRYYGTIYTLSIFNRTKYIYGADVICNKYGAILNCLNLPTSTSISYLATTVILNEAVSIHNSSYLLFLVVCFYLIRNKMN